MKYTYLLAKIFFGFSALVFAIMLYWLLFPYRPLVINEIPVPVDNTEVQRGETLQYVLDYCKNIDAPVLIRRKFTDGLEFAMPSFTTNSNKPGCREQVIGLEVPQSLPAGEYILHLEFEYQVNPIRRVNVTTHTKKFTVR